MEREVVRPYTQSWTRTVGLIRQLEKKGARIEIRKSEVIICKQPWGISTEYENL